MDMKVPYNAGADMLLMDLPWMKIAEDDKELKHSGICGCCGASVAKDADAMNRTKCTGIQIGFNIDKTQLKDNLNFYFEDFTFPDGSVMTLKLSNVTDDQKEIKLEVPKKA